jgi:hypothetical protein
VLEDVLRRVLDVLVEREAHGLARSGLGLAHGPQRVTGRIADDHLTPRAAGELLVVLHLHAGEAVTVDAGEAQHLGRRALHGIGALLLRIGADPGQIEGERGLGEGGVDHTRHVGEAAPRHRERPFERPSLLLPCDL